MSFDPISAAFDLGRTIIEKAWPDPAKQAAELRKLEELRQTGDLAQLSAHVKLMTGQLNVNAVEASHSSVFVAGWRPFIGWVAGAALAYQFVLYPLLMWVLVLKGSDVEPPPVLDTGVLFALVTSMLGVGAMRSHDKRHKVDSRGVGD